MTKSTNVTKVVRVVDVGKFYEYMDLEKLFCLFDLVILLNSYLNKWIWFELDSAMNWI